MKQDLLNNLFVGQSHSPAAVTADAAGSEVDIQNYSGVMVAINCGLWTDGTFTFALQESDTSGSGFADVADADIEGTEPVVDAGTEDEQIYEFGYKGKKRYLRVNCVVTGSPSTGMVFGSEIICGRGRYSGAHQLA